MASPISQLYQPLISRDVEAFPSAVRRFRKDHDSIELFQAVARFAILCYSPSQHGKHAVIACLSTYQLRDELGGRFDDVVSECGVYAALSRQPWSEPPVTDPPRVGPGHPFSTEEIREAIASGDRRRGECWLTRGMREPGFDRDFFRAASDDLGDLGHKLIVANTAWEIAGLLGDEGRYATLRVAVWEWVSYRDSQPEADPAPEIDSADLLKSLIAGFVAEQGGMVPFHALVLFEAALLAAERAGEPALFRRVSAQLNQTAPPALELAAVASRSPIEPYPYRLARDYGQLLKAYSLAKRLGQRFPDIDFEPMLLAARYNLEHGPSFEEWSFA
ncbi:MAG: hypothetical protein ABI718_13585 [Acidobacteriota bacterium]